MPLRVYSTWVHGTAGLVQSDQGFQVERLGYYLKLKADEPAEAWVHFSVPTQVNIGGPDLAAVAVRARTFGACVVQSVHVWDAERRLASNEVISAQLLEGEGLTESDPPGNGFAILRLGLHSPQRVTAGLSVAVRVAATRRLDAIAISGVGVELQDV